MKVLSHDQGLGQRSAERLRLVWFVRKQLDVALDRATWIQTASGLQEMCDVTLVSAYRDCPLEPAQHGLLLQVRTSRLPGVNFVSWAVRVRSLLKSAVTSGDYDVVVVDPDTLLSIPRAWLEQRKRTSLVVDVRTLPVPGRGARHALTGAVFDGAMAKAREVADGLMVISEPMAAHLARDFGWNREALGVWSSGVDPELFRCGADHEAGAGGTLRLVYHGSIARSRGIGALLKAVRMCAEEGRDVRLSIVGSGPDVKGLESEGADLVAAGRVEFVKPMSQRALSRYLCEHDAGVIPLPNEDCWNTSSPLKLLEYLSCGLPVVLTEIPAHTAVVTRPEIVVWAGGGSPNELAVAISACAARIDELSPKATSQGRALALGYTWARQARAFYEYVCRVHG
jgi:glycosyltransferase involved in cell wall biosynthesis